MEQIHINECVSVLVSECESLPLCVCVLVCCCCCCLCRWLWLLMHLACVARARITCILCRSCRNALQDLAASLSLFLHPSFSLSPFLCCSLCVFFTGHAPDGSLMTERMTRVHSTSTSPSVRPELLPLPACGKVLLPRCLLCSYSVATLSLGIICWFYQLVCNTLAKALAAGLCDKEPENLLDCVIKLQDDIRVLDWI